MNTQHKARPFLIAFCILLVLAILGAITVAWAFTYPSAPDSFPMQSPEELYGQMPTALFSHEPLHLREGHINALLKENAKELSLPDNMKLLGVQLNRSNFTLWVNTKVWIFPIDVAVQGNLSFDTNKAELSADILNVTAGKIPLSTKKVCTLLKENGVPLEGTRLSVSFAEGIPLHTEGFDLRAEIENIEFYSNWVDISLGSMRDQIFSFFSQFFM